MKTADYAVTRWREALLVSRPAQAARELRTARDALSSLSASADPIQSKLGATCLMRLNAYAAGDLTWQFEDIIRGPTNEALAEIGRAHQLPATRAPPLPVDARFAGEGPQEISTQVHLGVIPDDDPRFASANTVVERNPRPVDDPQTAPTQPLLQTAVDDPRFVNSSASLPPSGNSLALDDVVDSWREGEEARR